MGNDKLNKILIVTHGFPPSELGGTELYAYNLAKLLSSKGIKVLVYTRLTRPLLRKDDTTEGYVGEEFEGLRVFRSIDSFYDLREFLNPYISNTFRNIIRKEKPDLVHFQHLFCLSADLPEIASSCNIPCIMTLHDYWFICPRIQLLNKENKICDGPVEGVNCAFCFDTRLLYEYRLSNRLKKFIPGRFKGFVKEMKQDVDNKRISYTSRALEFNFRLNFLKRQFNLFKNKISPSRYLIKRYEKEGFKGIDYLPLGFPPVPKVESNFGNRLRLGYMGNINYPKGLSIVVKELVPLLRQKKIKLVIYGKPYDLQYFNEIKSVIAGIPSDTVKLYGGYKNSFEELWNIFSSFDVLIFPSVWEENSPIVVREALLAGKPVIASQLGGVPEIVKDGGNGLLFNPFKYGELRDKVERLSNDRELLKKLCSGALSTDIPTLEEHIDKVICLYEDMLPGGG